MFPSYVFCYLNDHRRCNFDPQGSALGWGLPLWSEDPEMEPEKSTIIPGRIENLTKKTGYQKPGAAKHASLQP